MPKKPNKVKLSTVIKAVSKAGDVSLTMEECRGVAELFHIDLEKLNAVSLVRTLVLIGVAKKKMVKATTDAPDNFSLDMLSLFEKLPKLKDGFLKEFGMTEQVDILIHLVAKQLVEDDDGSKETH